ncbi:MAG: signal peptidase I [Caulobacterales bacterium]
MTSDVNPKLSAAAAVWDNVKTIVYALGIALVVRVLLFQPFTIPSESMVPTLLTHDYIFVNKFAYGYSKHSMPFSPPLFNGRILDKAPNRGDVIVFKLPSDNKTDYIKRLIGLPGDHIQVKGGALYINDKPVQREQMPEVVDEDEYGVVRNVARWKETLPNGKSYITYDLVPNGGLDDTDVYVVPAGHFFMMGDNRDNSQDSRVLSMVGYVPEENLIGKAELVFLSFNDGASLFNPISWFSEFRGSRFCKQIK